MNALNDFISRQCEEMLEADSISTELNQKILKLESEFKEKLSPELRKEYGKLEELIIAANTYNENLIYRQCMMKYFNF